jgi:uncharacterized membrane protein
LSATAQSRTQVLEVRLQRTTVGLTLALIALVAAWFLPGRLSLGRVLMAVAATTPLWLGLPHLLRGARRTFAWMTLATIPYLVFALTEAIADPPARAWAGLCLFVGFALFVVQIAYLRVTR